MSSINKYLSVDEQLKKLEGKKLIFRNQRSKDKFKSYLSQYSYEIIIDEYSFEDFFSSDGKYYIEEIYPEDIMHIFDIDRGISSILLKYIKEIEMNLNTVIKNILCKEFQKNNFPPYLSLLNEKLLKSIFNNYKLRLGNKKNVKNSINMDLYEMKNLFYKYASKDSKLIEINKNNEKNEEEWIIKNINSSVKEIWNDPSIKKKLKDSNNTYINNHKKCQFVQIQKLANTWVFSFLIDIYKMLSNKHRRKIEKMILKYDKKDIQKIEYKDFYNFLKLFSDIRNKLSHNEKIIDYKLSIKSKKICKIISNWIGININKNTDYNLSILIKIIQKILQMEKNIIEDEINMYLTKKFEKSFTKKSDLMDKIIKNKLDIDLIKK